MACCQYGIPVPKLLAQRNNASSAHANTSFNANQSGHIPLSLLAEKFRYEPLYVRPCPCVKYDCWSDDGDEK